MPDRFERRIRELEDAISKLPQEALDNFIKFNQRHRYFVPLDGYHSIRHPLRDITCSATEVFLLSGNDKTGNSGTAELHLNDFLCHHAFDIGQRGVLISRPQFTALPTGDAPVVLTAKFVLSEIALQPNEAVGGGVSSPVLDVVVTVTSWNPDGSPAKDVSFSWVSTIEGARAFQIGG
ncbi:hypothetical protein GCM10010869_55360 [Mesorhizobium tianshanense]|uniref:Uncharacterized protein n=1 Tax=Mesorhizobium tianshanense TaxID=39844 RepID=A0A562NCD4_9HYPH|nr:hypothetical protein [Mesorhizobium tianshanense]TWI29784.1 hypothetical protein IQ26_04898 [Mesorhizobium tianshanense]GLS39939.1 hypothetical protein GCM10010869_55360 [Mesorhizobium tianshanense]